MFSSQDPHGLNLIEIESCEIFLGTDKGGWVHANERPRHLVSLPNYQITKDVISINQFNKIMGIDGKSEGSKDMVTTEIIDDFCKKLSEHFEHNVRLPSQSEWEAAKEKLSLPMGWTELLADEVTGNHRGAPLDGRPRIGEMIGPLSGHRTSQSAHPTKQGVYARVTTPGDRPLPKVGFRIVISPKRTEEVKRVPDNANLISNLKSELFWISLIGVIPSFCIPIIRGFSSYAIDGWANLLFGGLCVGFVSGAFWRPRRATWHLDENGDVTRMKD